MYSNFNRRETFRGTLLRLGEIHSILPEGVPIMALTATVTRTLQHEIARILGMCGPTVISVSPCKINIMYALAAPCHSIAITFRPILMRLKKERVKMPRIIIYCRKYEECADLYIYFRDELGQNPLNLLICQSFDLWICLLQLLIEKLRNRLYSHLAIQKLL